MRHLLMTITLLALILGAYGGEDADPAAVIEAYEAAYNSGDIDGVMAGFSEDSAINNHPTDAYAAGLADILALHVEDMAAAATQDAYTFSSNEVDGDVVTWDHVWINSAGAPACQSGHQATVEAGIIVSWFWPAGDVSFGSDCQ